MTPFTPQCDATILRCIQQNPSNLTAGFEVASRLLGRSKQNVTSRYYRKIRPNQTTIAVASNAGVIHAGKNTIRRNVVPDADTVRDAMLHASVSRLNKDTAIKFLLEKMSNQAKSELLIRIANRVGGQ